MVLSRTDCACSPEPATSKIGRLLMLGLLLLAGDRGEQGAHLALDEAQRGAVLQRGAAVGGALHVRVDGVAVEAGLGGPAGVLERGRAGGDGVLDVAFVGRRGHARPAGGPPFAGAGRGVQGGIEVQVLGLVAGGVGIGQVAGDHLHPLLAQGQGVGVDTHIGRDRVEHGDSIAEGRQCSGKARARTRRKSVAGAARAPAGGAQAVSAATWRRRVSTWSASSWGLYLATKALAPTRSTMALLNTPDSEVCSSTYSPARPGLRRISVVRV